MNLKRTALLNYLISSTALLLPVCAGKPLALAAQPLAESKNAEASDNYPSNEAEKAKPEIRAKKNKIQANLNSVLGNLRSGRKAKKAKEPEIKAQKVEIKVNDNAPDIALPDQSGKIRTLKEFRGKKAVVLFFYQKDASPLCAKEACSFRDSYSKFQELGAEVIGISSDKADSHRKFAEKNDLSFPLLADSSAMARKAFGVPPAARLLPGRVTYVIDKDGVVRFVFQDLNDTDKHVSQTKDFLTKLNES